MSIKLSEIMHPQKNYLETFDALVGIDEIKTQLLDHLLLFLEPDRLSNWQKKHFPKGFKNSVLAGKIFQSPLIILAGEVGCGKTALAHAVPSAAAKKIGNNIVVLETPSNIRGSGLVGELSSRISAAFDIAAGKVTKKTPGILIIDEADDLATSRSQNQAHHEDRAGLNVLIKQIDLMREKEIPMAVILITNRLDVLDPAILRRSELTLLFKRPGKEGIVQSLRSMLFGTKHTESDIEKLTSIALTQSTPFSYSDLFVRVGQRALRASVLKDEEFGPAAIEAVLRTVKPTPLLDKSSL